MLCVQIDVKGAPRDVHDFPGLYCLQLPRQPFLRDGKTLVLATAWRSVQTVLAVDLTRSAPALLCPTERVGCSFPLLKSPKDFQL